MTEASTYLQALARRCTQVYLVHTAPQAVLLTGSAAQGESDSFSDLDLIIYYDELPSDEALRGARDELYAPDSRALFPRSEQAYGESHSVDGVECQVVHYRTIDWEEGLRRALDEYDADPILQKMLGGLLEGMSLHGAERIDGWKARAAAYPDELARAMIEKHLQFFPLWYLQNRKCEVLGGRALNTPIGAGGTGARAELRVWTTHAPRFQDGSRPTPACVGRAQGEKPRP